MISAVMASGLALGAQQMPDRSFRPMIEDRAHAIGTGPEPAFETAERKQGGQQARDRPDAIPRLTAHQRTVELGGKLRQLVERPEHWWRSLHDAEA